MKLAVLSRHRRLLALCACSAAIHLALLAWFAGPGTGAPASAPEMAEELVLRLAPAAPRAAPATAPAATEVASKPVAVAANIPAVSAVPAPAGLAARSEAGAERSAADEAAEALQVSLPGRYRVRLPASAQLAYTRSVERPGAAPLAAGAARLDWRSDGRHYSLRLDGVTGRIASEGDQGDLGLLPESSTDEGSGLVTQFDHLRGRVRYGAGAAPAPGVAGILDRASMLIQLAGMGLAAPDQVSGSFTMVVAGSTEATLVRWQVIGDEQVETGIGTLATRHLAEVAAPGRPRLEVWLAPERDWLPVRLRLVEPDGASATQTLATLAQDPAEP